MLSCSFSSSCNQGFSRDACYLKLLKLLVCLQIAGYWQSKQTEPSTKKVSDCKKRRRTETDRPKGVKTCRQNCVKASSSSFPSFDVSFPVKTEEARKSSLEMCRKTTRPNCKGHRVEEFSPSLDPTHGQRIEICRHRDLLRCMGEGRTRFPSLLKRIFC